MTNTLAWVAAIALFFGPPVLLTRYLIVRRRRSIRHRINRHYGTRTR